MAACQNCSKPVQSNVNYCKDCEEHQHTTLRPNMNPVNLATESMYNLRPVQQIINTFIRGSYASKPRFDLEYKARYPEIEHVTGLSPKEVLHLLNKLYYNGILKRHSYERLTICTKCSSPNLGLRFYCNDCESPSIERHMVIEHVLCGFVDIDEKFYSHKMDDGHGTCPRCSSAIEIPSTNVRIHRNWYICTDCEKRFNDPLRMFVCRDCKNRILVDEVIFEDIHSYSLNDNVDSKTIVSPDIVIQSLQNLGYVIDSPGYLTGKSGMKYRFDIVIKEPYSINQTTVVIDIVFSNVAVEESHISKLFSSAFDIGNIKLILVAVPDVTERAAKMAKTFEIELIRTKNVDDVAFEIDKVINKWKKNRN